MQGLMQRVELQVPCSTRKHHHHAIAGVVPRTVAGRGRTFALQPFEDVEGDVSREVARGVRLA